MLKIKVGLTKNPRFEPLIDGTIKSAKVHLDTVVTTPPELFFRNLKNDEFDVFEMSLSEYLITREQAKGDRWDWAALPIFPAKAFVWLGLVSGPLTLFKLNRLKSSALLETLWSMRTEN